MIKVENLSYEFPQKELYKEVSFTLADHDHCAFIGTNGTGKTTLVEMLIGEKDFIYDGKIIKDDNCIIGYVSQFSTAEEKRDITVFDYVAEEFVAKQLEINRICEEMSVAPDVDMLLEQYQVLFDAFQAIDGDNYSSNIKKQLDIAKLSVYENLEISKLSSGEFKLIQIIKAMLLQPTLLIMDEPDVYLDFHHMNALRDLMNSHKGTLLVITHNRY